MFTHSKIFDLKFSKTQYYSSLFSIPGYLIIIMSLVFFISACDDDPSGPDTDFPDHPGFDVEIGEETKIMSDHVAEAGLMDIDEEEHTFIFDADVVNDADLDLQEGDILLIEKLALRRISSIDEAGGEITMETDFATLSEAFENADVEMSEEINFTDNRAEKIMLEFDGHLLEANKRNARGDLEWEYEIDDFTVEGSLEVGETSAEINLRVSYDIGEFTGAFVASTTLDQFNAEKGFEIQNHEAQSFTYVNNGVVGEMDFEFIMAGWDDPDPIRYTPPMPAIILPFTVGVIPVTLRIGTSFATLIDLGEDGSALFDATFSYGGDMGFNVAGDDFVPVITDNILEPNRTEAEGGAAGFAGQVSGQAGVALPEISLNLFGDAIVPYLRQEFFIGSSFTFPTCMHLFSDYRVSTGLDMDILGGLADFSQEHILAETRLHDQREDCESKMPADFESPELQFEGHKVYDQGLDFNVPYHLHNSNR